MGGTHASGSFCFDGYELLPGSRELRGPDGAAIEIPPQSFDVLLYLIENRDRVVSKDELFDTIWGETVVGDNSLAQCIWAARRALRDTGGRQGLIKNLRGRGYRFVGDLDPRRRPRAIAPESPAASALIGRARELAQLEGALGDALSGEARICLLSGEAGVGKTRLMEAVAARARERGMRVCVARCVDDSGSAPLWPWQQAVRELFRQLPPELPERLAADGAGDLVKLVPELDECIPSVSRPPARALHDERLLLFDAITRLLTRASEDAPLLVVIDDLHWAESPSLLMLQYLAASVTGARLCVLAAHRPISVDTDLGERLQATLGHAGTLHVSLSPLDREATAALLRRGADDVSDALVDRVFELTTGNPFFVQQLGRLVSAAGPDGELPRGAGEVILRRFSMLPDACRELLTLGAVIGQEFRLSDLRRAESLDSEGVLEAIDQASAARLLDEDAEQVGLYRFAHPSVREALYGGLSRIRRVRLHRRIADSIATASGDDPGSRLDELAHHYYEAAAGGSAAEAVRYCRMAAQRAFEATAYEEAVSHYRRALAALELDEPIDEQLRCRLLLDLGLALAGTAEPVERVREVFADCAERATRMGAADLLAEAAMAHCGRGGLSPRIFREIGTLDSAEVDLLERALSMLPPQDSAQRSLASGYLAWCLYNSDQRTRRAELAREGLEMARRLGDPDVLAEALMLHHKAVRGPAVLEARIEILTEVIALSGPSRRTGLQLDAHGERGWAHYEAGRIDEATRDMDAAMRLSRELHHDRGHVMGLAWRLCRLCGEGRFDEAGALADSRPLRFPALEPRVNQGAEIRHMMIMLFRDRLEEVVPALEQLAEKYPLPVGWHCGLASSCATLGRLDDARRHLEQLTPDGDFGLVPDDHNTLSSLCFLSNATVALSDLPRAKSLYAMLRPFGERLTLVGAAGFPGGPVARCLGQLAGRLDDVEAMEAHFTRGAELCRRAGVAIWLPWIRLDHAEQLLLRGDTARARELAEQALAEARSVESPLLERRAGRLLNDAGGPGTG